METSMVTLIDVLSISLLLEHTAPYIPVQSLVNLSRTSRRFRVLLKASPEVWRYLNLTTVRRSIEKPISTAQANDDVTEDDFYAAPLRGVFSQLHQQSILRNVHTLILDGMSVPVDLIREIIAEDRFNVRILSVREARHMNMTKLNQLLRYIVRPTRAEGTPRLKALYVFGSRSARLLPEPVQHPEDALGVMSSPGAQIGAEYSQRSVEPTKLRFAGDEDLWYGSSGKVMKRPLSEWPETLQVCKGLIQFDATLCRGPRHDITKVDSKDFLQSTIATVALGSSGCETCLSCPEGPAPFGEHKNTAFPLLGPAPLHSSTVRAAIRPTPDANGKYPPLILRCEDCLRDRWCEQCNRFWCEDCYTIPTSRNLSIATFDGLLSPSTSTNTTSSTGSQPPGQTTKVFSRLCVENCLVSEMMSGAGSNGMWG
jgi:hypothetical protein